MPEGKAGSIQVPRRIIGSCLIATALAACAFFCGSQAFASFGSESTDQVIGVGRIQSSPTAAPASGSSTEPTDTTHFIAPAPLVAESTEVLNQLSQPLDRGIEDLDAALAGINMVQRYGEPDEDGWFTTLASSYGPSNAGQWTALGTELTLESMDIGCQIGSMDVLLGRYVDIMYGGTVLRCRVVDTGQLAPGRLFDIQPGVCLAFGMSIPEGEWGVRTVKWRLAE